MEERYKVYKRSHVLNILSTNHKIQKIPQQEIDILKRLERSRVPMEFSNKKIRLHEMDRVMINSGVLKGVEGFVDKVIGRSKVHIKAVSLSGSFIVDSNNLMILSVKDEADSSTRAHFI